MDFNQIMSAIKWRMGSQQEAADAQRNWEEIETWLSADPERLDAAAASMAKPLIEIIRWRLISGTDQGNKEDLSASRWSALKTYLHDHAGMPSEMALAISSFISERFKEANFSAPSEQDTQASRVDDPPDGLENTLSATDSSNGQTEVSTAAMDTNDLAKETASSPEPNVQEDQPTLTDEQESSDEVVTTAPDSNPTSLSTQWKWLPVPPDSPDNHDEAYQSALSSPGGLKLIGARVRGKKHKHEGTNCDDWFEFDVSGPWTIIAVSDGAGSKIFSRIGAKESCQAALSELKAALGEHVLQERDNWSGGTFKRDKKTGVFNAEDLEHVQEALHNAMAKAYEAVEKKAQALAESAPHEEFLGRKVVVDDLSGTLLLAVHTTVLHEGAERSVVLTCQIGDGMLAAVSTNGGLQLLGIPDSGEFAGQTEFLTSKKKLEKANLVGKTFPFFGPLEALMVMTDGVADDYFPNDPNMLRLYGDLAINRVLRLWGPDLSKDSAEIDRRLAQTQLKTKADVELAELAVPFETLSADGPQQVFIRSVETYAEKLGLKLDEVISDRLLLIAGQFGEGMLEKSTREEETPEDMLRVWLDSYQVRGSFDDRTLVVLHPEVAS